MTNKQDSYDSFGNAIDFSGLEEPDHDTVTSSPHAFEGSRPKDSEEGDPEVTAEDEGKEEGEVSDDILLRAEELGLNQDDLKGLPKGKVKKILDSFESYLELVPKEPAPSKSTETEKTKEETKEEEPVDLGDIDEDTTKALKGLMGQVKSLRQELASVRQEAMASNRVDLHRQMESQFSDLGTKFGKGATQRFGEDNPKGAHKLRRRGVERKVEMLMAGYKSIGQEPPEIGKVFDEALRSTLGDEYAKMAQSHPAKAAAKTERESQLISRPRSRKASPGASGEKKAIQTAAKFMREHGMMDEDVEVPSEEGDF